MVGLGDGVRFRRRGDRDLDLEDDELEEGRGFVTRFGGLGDFETDREMERRGSLVRGGAGEGDLDLLSFLGGGALFLISLVSLKVSFIFSVSFTSFLAFVAAVVSGGAGAGGGADLALEPEQKQRKFVKTVNFHLGGKCRLAFKQITTDLVSTENILISAPIMELDT